MSEATAIHGDLMEMEAGVASYITATGRDYTDAAAMHGRCEDESRALAEHLVSMGVEAWAAQKWMDRVPDALEGNEMAGGHFVVIAETDDGDRCEIDLTAAQFPELGWDRPRARWI